MKKTLLSYSGTLAIWLAPFVAFAQGTPSSPINTMQDLVNLMCKIFGYMFYGLMALSLIMVIIGGFNYVTAGDNSEKVSKANRTILYAAIGIAVSLIAKALPLIVGSFLGASTTNLNSC